MNATEIAQATVLYKSPKSVRKGLSLRDMFPSQRFDFRGGVTTVTDRIRVLVSIRPGYWQQGESFDNPDHAFDLVEDYESRGYRVKILDCSAE